ncbi:putative Cyclic nucleotide-binding domain containing protein [Monocercomonoides exilis]|uniref:putative Cyclic nucleotide-binding domain containing protein n=1 Tax=Monocercomonoides exilis TaxID=2049356 RepID=UPI00355ABC54|nr:putative Cyclic nucleotide-binding domain containing protein [Monocercomonoides exilis]|eukprot:MONOS_1049.1-p1 / transcript=MONOS_1049.1 / gene=MONOS_1049 / organism=Monocercomonoides_exilis_PA203 / gene_product=Cyclic nucleotide-binding domain containing protein / transcript_product=Cyclic nucleotide-binding domain containing protein / location=Mono_scaffold00017:237632-239232(+) / protein_length=243 / sequence_SO=supercontig / SO=protein_coding / is_pseudo=false
MFPSETLMMDDPPDAFYIIMSGHIIVTKRLETGFVRLQPGDGFGQLGILKKTPRSATCTAEGQTELIRVSAEDYERLFEQQHERELSERVAFLKDISVLRHLTDEEVKLMAEVMTEQHFAPNKVIITEGDDASSMYFIVSGKASIVMTIVYKGIPRFVEVTRIGVNDYFGELALLNSVPRSASVVAHVPLTCLVLSRIDFGRFIAGSTLQAMKEASKRYVSREEITRLFVEKQHWDQYKVLFT